jgi:uncharacterized membrane protein
MMTKNDKVILIVTTIVCLLPLALYAAVYADLPDQVPFHWNVSGEPDSWGAKEFIWIIPVGMALMNAFVQLMMFITPQKNNIPHMFKKIVAWIIPIITMILFPVTIFYALGVNISISLVVLLILGILILVLGNYMPKVRPNNVAGIRVPWTLNNEENWNKTNRLAGWLFTIGGLAIIIEAFTMQSIPLAMFIVTMTELAIVTIVPIVYSYSLYKKLKLMGEEK